MKSYWIAAAAVLLTWPSSSKAYVAGLNQIQVEDQPVRAAQPANSPASQVPAGTQPAKAREHAVQKETPSSSSVPAATQPRSSYILVELSRSLKAKKLKAGDTVKAEVSQDVVAHGKVIIPVETKLVGHVTEVGVRDGAGSESRLGIVFDRILLKHYHDINIQAVIQAMAPPMERRSRVDEPSQMLPPSMMGGGGRQAPLAGGRSGTSGSRSTTSAAVGSSGALGDPGPLQTPITIKQSPSTNAGAGSAGALLETTPGAKPMGVGVPQGVIGIKGLSLSKEGTASTPGPVVISNTANVKLESGTQILLRVMSVEMPKAAAK